MKLTVTKNNGRKPQAGFTLIEMVLVLAIMALLVGGAISLLSGVQDHAKEVRVHGDFSSIESALTIYESKSLGLPTSAQGLKSLVDKPTVAPIPRNWSRQLDNIPVDPWGVEYRYTYPGVKRPGKFDLVSAGPDRIFDTADDLGNWQEGSK
ncbi:MAG: type II secretion system major pseudopilin GspG [Verrucomicrobiales bacterium]